MIHRNRCAAIRSITGSAHRPMSEHADRLRHAEGGEEAAHRHRPPLGQVDVVRGIAIAAGETVYRERNQRV